MRALRRAVERACEAVATGETCWIVGTHEWVFGCVRGASPAAVEPLLPGGIDIIGCVGAASDLLLTATVTPGTSPQLILSTNHGTTPISVEIVDEMPWNNFLIVRTAPDTLPAATPSPKIAAVAFGDLLFATGSANGSTKLGTLLTSSKTVHCRMLFDLSALPGAVSKTPVLRAEPLCVLPIDATFEQCYSALETSLTRQITAAKALSVLSSAMSVAHFLPIGCAHPLSIVFPDDAALIASSQMSSARRVAQQAFFLPIDRPLLHPRFSPRLSDSIIPVELPATQARLRDVQTQLGLIPISGKSGRTVVSVRGSIDYYHYMQDGIDDNGWGCAYRSMQTLCSWVIHAGFSSQQAVPMHREIQQMLVELGDKPASFVGSKKWIGAIEISLCLQKLYGMDCRVLNIQSGSQVPQHSRAIAEHFAREGTPVMIGGGVLAYTLLGIDFNESSSSSTDPLYLILDPHYVGGESLQAIKSGGWCAWKKADIFLKDHFYNLCMPLRPAVI